MAVDEFIQRWQQSGGAEMANSQLFLNELCQLLNVPQPESSFAKSIKKCFSSRRLGPDIPEFLFAGEESRE